MIEKTMEVDRMEDVISVFGSFDQNLRMIETEYNVRVTDRDEQIHITGEAENVLYAEKAIAGLLSLAAKGEEIGEQNVRYIFRLVREGREQKIQELAGDVVCITAKGKPIKAKTLGQRAYLDAIEQNTITLGVGPAGTGKTMLAVEKARMLASQGKKALYLCFNEFLLQYLRRHYHDPQITFHNVRTLAEEILQDDTLPLNKVVAVFEQYFESEFNDDDWAYPNIVVDEGQDLSDSILEHLSFLAELQDGCFYIFYDRNQYIMSRKTTGWIDKNAECRLVLYKNCRNTAEIATSIGKLMHMKDSYVNTIQGMTPKAVFYGNEKELQKQADRFVKDMCQQGVALKDMVILTAHSVGHSGLKGCRTLNGIPVTTEPEDGKILFTSVRKFKGLEATAVLLIDVNLSELPDDLMQRLIYVGSSRATMYLKIAFCEDIEKKNYGPILDALTDEPVKHNRSGLVKTLHLEAD